MKKSKILITGGTGFLGKNLAFFLRISLKYIFLEEILEMVLRVKN